MKFPIILFSAFFVATLFSVGLAVSQTAGTKRANPSQTASASHQQVMEECKARYGGRSRPRWQNRYVDIEACFKEKTGMYPFQAHVDCIYRFAGRGLYC